MSKIQIKSKKLLNFPPAYRDCEIIIEIDLIQNFPSESCYILRILDKAFKEFEETITENIIDEEALSNIPEEDRLKEDFVMPMKKITKQVLIKKQVGETVVRNTNRKYSYEEINKIISNLGFNEELSNLSAEKINELFRQGLLLITQEECLKQEGIYFSEASDWEIVRD